MRFAPRGGIRHVAGLAVAAAWAFGIVFYESLTTSTIAGLLYGNDTSSSSSSSSAAAAAASDPGDHQLLCDRNGTPTPLGTRLAGLVPRLNDPTVGMSPCVHRPWVHRRNDWDADGHDLPTPHRVGPSPSTATSSPPPRDPPFKVLLTNFGWNHPNRTFGLNVTRGVRSREFILGIINHPYFDPTDWDEVQRQAVAETNNGTVHDNDDNDNDGPRYYVFLDVETCLEHHYPTYGANVDGNLDGINGRTTQKESVTFDCYNAAWCPQVRQVLKSPLFQLYPNRTRILYLDCHGTAMPWKRRQELISDQFAIASISASTDQLVMAVDQGLPPPVVASISLTSEHVRDVHTCEAERNRPFLFTFVGSVRNNVRGNLTKLHDPANHVITLDLQDYVQQYNDGTTNVTFPDLLLGSVFAGAPAGDDRYSYRFAEVMAAGAIPVVHSDNWVLPFRPELVDWSQCLLHLPESTIPNTIDILRNITEEKRCQMRKKCWEIYNNYMVNTEVIVRGLLDGLELVKAKK